MRISGILSLLLCFLSFSCGDNFSESQSDRAFLGAWVVELADGGPRFRLEIDQKSDGGLTARILNDTEIIVVPAKRLAGGAISLQFEHYDSELTLGPLDAEGVASGQWRKTKGEGRVEEMSLKASRPAVAELAKDLAAAEFLSGRWRVDFTSSEAPAVATIVSRGDGRIAGTFETELGDYRFLEGVAHRRSLRLSCFDGAHAFDFQARLDDGGVLIGTFRSGKTWKERWRGYREASAKVSDGFQRATWSSDVAVGELSFRDMAGDLRRLDDVRHGGPVRLIYFFGSWCPNCHDAAKFMAELQETYGSQGLQVVGVAFELTDDFARAKRQIERYMARHEASYPVLLGGLWKKDEATKTLGGLDELRAYPTFLFCDAEGQVSDVYSGFSGPATGKAHERLVSSFHERIKKLLAK